MIEWRLINCHVIAQIQDIGALCHEAYTTILLLVHELAWRCMYSYCVLPTLACPWWCHLQLPRILMRPSNFSLHPLSGVIIVGIWLSFLYMINLLYYNCINIINWYISYSICRSVKASHMAQASKIFELTEWYLQYEPFQLLNGVIKKDYGRIVLLLLLGGLVAQILK